MIPCTQCHTEFRRRVNRRNTAVSSRISAVGTDSYLEEAYKLWFKVKIESAEIDSKARNALRQLEVKNKKMSVKCHDGFYTADYPKDYYSTLHYTVKASKKGCEGCDKMLIPIIVRSNDLSESLKDPFRKPSFEYEEVLVDEAGDSLVLYTNNEFDIGTVLLSYYKRITPILCPSMAVEKFYVNGRGETVNKDVGLEIDSTYDFDDIIDLAVLFFLRDVSDNVEMDTQMQKISLKYQIKI
jgi:hypothetical protein